MTDGEVDNISDFFDILDNAHPGDTVMVHAAARFGNNESGFHFTGYIPLIPSVFHDRGISFAVYQIFSTNLTMLVLETLSWYMQRQDLANPHCCVTYLSNGRRET